MGAFLKFLDDYFEPISLTYHVVFISFFGWLMCCRPADFVVPPALITFLGIYVLAYGLILVVWGNQIMNRNIKHA
jgi:hypothetical protein